MGNFQTGGSARLNFSGGDKPARFITFISLVSQPAALNFGEVCYAR
jgi:hypothetical protein